jgi:hypothetical protein
MYTFVLNINTVFKSLSVPRGNVVNICLFTANHCAILSSDHFVAVCKKSFKGTLYFLEVLFLMLRTKKHSFDPTGNRMHKISRFII